MPEPRESIVVADIRKDLGMEDDLVLWRLGQGSGTRGGRFFRGGIVPGASDLIGILGPHGKWFCLEVKRAKGGVLSARQKLFLALVRRMGGFAAAVRSVEEARAALERARRGESE
jgi:hypothetical protein